MQMRGDPDPVDPWQTFGSTGWELVKTDQCASAERPYDVPEWSGVLIDDWFGLEERRTMGRFGRDR